MSEAPALHLPDDWRRALAALHPRRCRCEDLALAVIEAVEEGRVRLRGTVPTRPVGWVRLGRMWVRPGETEWSLADRLEPAWRAPA
ncbi:MAG TPA: hypothetical protein VEZ70_12995 [Allosphingosinicella sp.]|nr:hypothetical protein [Allosphingosinicella sp.]